MVVARISVLSIAIVCSLALSAQAAQIDWTDWQSGTMSPGLMRGKIGAIHVTLNAPSILSSQAGLTVGEPVYWRSTVTYQSPIAENAPVTPDIVKVSAAHTYSMTFSEPVTNPVIALVSLGGGSLTPVMWNFGTTPVTILSQGPGAFGGTLTSCVLVTATILQGQECHGVIQLVGTYTSIAWTQNVFENWIGFTVGVPRASQQPPPPPSAMVNVQFTLTWERGVNPDPAVISAADGFRVYRAQGALCDAPDPLPIAARHANTPETTGPSLTYIDTAAIHQVAGPLCYEVSAYNLVGESAHSNRASVVLDAAVPAPPTGVTITNVVGP